MKEEKKKKNIDILSDEETVENDKKEKKLSKEEIELNALREENDKIVKELSEMSLKYQMALAEQQNIQKRADREISDHYKYSTFSLCKELLKTIDSLDLALEKEQSNEEMKSYLDGFKMIRNGLYEALKKEGVSEIEALGKISDPHTMEPISVMHVEGKENEEVIAVFQKGYMYKDRVLRAAKVVVNQNEDEPQDDANKE